ncbi:MAG: tetratricopeptide repeat protein [Myxococcota bacterium]|nr:tetratricopeptide repeat protein [Myxococcales bacterium]
MRRWIHALLVTAACVALVAPALAQSGDAGGGDDKGGNTAEEEANRPRGGLPGPQVAKKLQEVQLAMTDERMADARKLLDELARRRGLKEIEQATIYMFYGYVANGLEDYPKAIAYFEKAISLDVLTWSQQYNLEWSVGQLYAMQGQYEKALEVQREWLRKASRPNAPVRPQPHNFYVFALSYMQTDPPNPKAARRPAEIAVEMSDEPQENWLRLLGQIYYMLGDYTKMAEVLEQLLVRFNKPEYYTQLSGAYAEAGKEKKALGVLQLAYTSGLLQKDREVVQLARLYLFHEMPERAGAVLEKAIADGILERDKTTNELLSEAYIFSREPHKAFEPLAAAAREASDGELYMRLGQIMINTQVWPQADDALGKALAKGGLRDPGSAHILRGIARMNQNHWNDALASFRAATGFDTSKQDAEAYIKFLDYRRRQVEALQG